MLFRIPRHNLWNTLSRRFWKHRVVLAEVATDYWAHTGHNHLWSWRPPIRKICLSSAQRNTAIYGSRVGRWNYDNRGPCANSLGWGCLVADERTKRWWQQVREELHCGVNFGIYTTVQVIFILAVLEMVSGDIRKWSEKRTRTDSLTAWQAAATNANKMTERAEICRQSPLELPTGANVFEI